MFYYYNSLVRIDFYCWQYVKVAFIWFHWSVEILFEIKCIMVTKYVIILLKKKLMFSSSRCCFFLSGGPLLKIVGQNWVLRNFFSIFKSEKSPSPAVLQKTQQWSEHCKYMVSRRSYVKSSERVRCSQLLFIQSRWDLQAICEGFLFPYAC